MSSNTHPRRMTLTAENVTVRAQGCVIVKDASVTLGPGELVGLIGPNGAGKSTLLRALVGVAKRSAGEIRINGQAVRSLSTTERARALAYLPQERRVEWRLSAHAVVMLGRFPHRRGFGAPSRNCAAAVDRALDLVGASALATRSAAVLSGGELTRVLLARALAVEAPLLLADEPIAGLDPYHQIHVMEILKRAAGKGVGVMAVLHDLALAARFMDRLILLHHGEVVDCGAPAQVLTEKNLAQVYHVSALRGGEDHDTYLLPWLRLPDD